MSQRKIGKSPALAAPYGSPTERDFEVLGELIGGYDSAVKFGREGVAPLDFGGSNGSDHSYRATRLVSLGLAEHRKRGYDWGEAPSRGYRGSKVYRPTQAGRDAYSVWRDPWRHKNRQRSRLVETLHSASDKPDNP